MKTGFKPRVREKTATHAIGDYKKKKDPGKKDRNFVKA